MEGCQLNNELPLGNAPTPLNLDDEDSREALERSETDMEEDGEFEYEAPDSPAPYLDDPSKSTEWGLLYSQLNSMALATSTTTFESQKCLASDLQDVFLTTGCPNIDAFLNGGVIQSGMTEITGPGGSGKTQLALQLCITCQLPEHLGGLNKGRFHFLVILRDSRRISIPKDWFAFFRFDLCLHFQSVSVSSTSSAMQIF